MIQRGGCELLTITGDLYRAFKLGFFYTWSFIVQDNREKIGFCWHAIGFVQGLHVEFFRIENIVML